MAAEESRSMACWAIFLFHFALECSGTLASVGGTIWDDNILILLLMLLLLFWVLAQVEGLPIGSL